MSLISRLIKEDIASNPEAKVLYDEYDENLEFAITIVNLRKELGWSQRDLASAIDKPQSTIGRIESGESKPSIDTLKAIAKATGKELRIEYV